jgi:hypothetical protein
METRLNTSATTQQNDILTGKNHVISSERADLYRKHTRRELIKY